MSSPSTRGATRRARIARQFRQIHTQAAALIQRRLAPFWAAVTDEILTTLSRAHSPALHVDQIFSGEQWRPLFNAALIPGLKTTIYTGVSFEAEWVRNATGETTRQSISNALTQQIHAEGSNKGKTGHFGENLHSIQLVNFGQDFGQYFPESFSDPVSRSVSPLISRPGEESTGARSSIPLLGRISQRGPGGSVPSIDVALSSEIQAEVEKFLRTRTVGVWSKVSTTTRRMLQTTIRCGLAEGDSLDDLTSRIRATLTHYSDYEARRIARTETTGGMNFGQQAERNELGIEHKEWVSTIDARNRGANPKSRFDHLECAGQTVANHQAFLISGEQLMFPGDISLGASGGNVIHCRCCAVGAWPTGGSNGKVIGGGESSGVRPGGVGGAVIDPSSRAAISRMNTERHSAETAERVREVTALLAKHDEKLEKIRQKVLTVPDQIAKIDPRYIEAAQELEKTKRRLDYAEEIGDQKEIIRWRAAQKAAMKRLGKIQDQREDLRVRGRGFIAKLIRPVNQAAIEVTYDASVTPAMRRKAEKAREYLANVVSNETAGPLTYRVTTTGLGRSYYDPATRTMHMSPKSPTTTYIHEMGHGVEAQGNLMWASKGLLYKRTRDDVITVLKQRFPGVGFNPWEVALEDKFYRGFSRIKRRLKGLYTGKHYVEFTEILSHGMELLYAGGSRFAAQDPEYFKFVVAVVLGLIKVP